MLFIHMYHFVTHTEHNEKLMVKIMIWCGPWSLWLSEEMFFIINEPKKQIKIYKLRVILKPQKTVTTWFEPDGLIQFKAH